MIDKTNKKIQNLARLKTLIVLINTVWIEWQCTARPNYNNSQTLSTVRPCNQCFKAW